MKTENASYAHCFAQCGPLAKPQDLVKCKKTRSNPTAKWENRKSEAMRHAKCIKFPLLCLPVKIRPSPSCPKPRPLCPGEKKRLSTSRYDFGVSCIIKRKPSEDRALSPQRGSRSSVLRGFSFYNAGHPKTVPRSRKSLLFPMVFFKLASSRLAS